MIRSSLDTSQFLYSLIYVTRYIMNSLKYFVYSAMFNLHCFAQVSMFTSCNQFLTVSQEGGSRTLVKRPQARDTPSVIVSCGLPLGGAQMVASYPGDRCTISLLLVNMVSHSTTSGLTVSICCPLLPHIVSMEWNLRVDDRVPISVVDDNKFSR